MTIQELAMRARVTPRTVRYYVQEGVLPPPGRGRPAEYTGEHLRRLAMIRRLKDQYLPLEEIRDTMQRLTLEEVEELLTRSAEARGTADRLSSASDYIEGVLNQTAVREEMKRNASSPLPPPPPSPAPAVMPAPFFSAPGGVAYSYPAPPDLEQRSRATLSGKSLQVQSELEQNGPWQRITIAPGIELHFVLTDDAQTNSIAAQILDAAQEIVEENTGELP